VAALAAPDVCRRRLTVTAEAAAALRARRHVTRAARYRSRRLHHCRPNDR